MIKKGTKDISSLYFNGKQITQGYLGDKLVFTSSKPFKIWTGSSRGFTLGFGSSNGYKTDVDLYYSLDNGKTWNHIDDFNTTIFIPGGKTGITLKGNNPTGFCDRMLSRNISFAIGEQDEVSVEGNIMNLINPDTPTKYIPCDWCFCRLFSNMRYINPRNLELPATVLKESCYEAMFQNCTFLHYPPKLPATTLAKRCYAYMFNGCEWLETAPELPAMIMAEDCYSGMFRNCYRLAPPSILPATTLARGCYGSMFNGCRFETAPELPATTLEPYCYQQLFDYCSKLKNIKCLAVNGVNQNGSTANWVRYAGYNASGSKTFTKNPNATDWTRGDSGIPSGWTVQDAVI